MININAGHNAKLMEKCEALAGYAYFIGLIREKQKDGISIEHAVNDALEECIEEGVLREYLRKRRQEVKDMILTEFDKDAYEVMIREEGREEGLKEGIKEGIKEGRTAGMQDGKFISLQNLIKNGIPEEEGMRLLEFTEAEVSSYHVWLEKEGKRRENI